MNQPTAADDIIIGDIWQRLQKKKELFILINYIYIRVFASERTQYGIYGTAEYRSLTNMSGIPCTAAFVFARSRSTHRQLGRPALRWRPL